MKGFKLDKNGDIIINNLDKIPSEPEEYYGKSEQKAQWNQAEGVTSQVVTTDGQGKNKFDKSKYLKLSNYTLPEGATYTYAEIPLEPNKTYTVSVVRKDGFDGTGYGYLLISDTSGINNNLTAVAHQTDASINNSPYTVYSGGKLYIGYHPTYPSAMTQEKLDYIWEHTDVQIEEGTTATTYEDYIYDSPSPSHPSNLTSNIPAGSYQIPTESGIYEVTLTEDLHGLDDTYRDKICFDSVSGKGYLEQNTQADHIKNYTLLNLNSLTHETLHFVYNVANIDKSKLTYSDVGKIKCTHFQYVSGSYHPTSNNIHLYLSPDTNNNIFFDIRKENLDITDFSDRTANIESCKRWLNENDPIVISPRTTPFKTALTFTKVTSSTLPVLPWTAYGKQLIPFEPYTTNSTGGTTKYWTAPPFVLGQTYYFGGGVCEDGTAINSNNSAFIILKNGAQVYNKSPNRAITITADMVGANMVGLYTNATIAGKTVTQFSGELGSVYSGSYEPFNPTPPESVTPTPDYPYVTFEGTTHIKTQTGYGIELHGLSTVKDVLSIDKKYHDAKVTRNLSFIESYDGETIEGEYMSSTGSLTTGAKVLYKLQTPIIEEITYKEPGIDCEIRMIDGNELVRQTVQIVLSTNKGEWFFNEELGIKFPNILGKNLDENIIRNEIQQGLLQVDSSFIMTSFEMSFDMLKRNLKISFTAQNDSGDEISGVTNYA